MWIEIPTGFTEMQQRAPERALAWRMDVRQMFEDYLAKGYRAVDFVLQREAGFGTVSAGQGRIRLRPGTSGTCRHLRHLSPGGQVRTRPPSTCRWM